MWDLLKNEYWVPGFGCWILGGCFKNSRFQMENIIIQIFTILVLFFLKFYILAVQKGSTFCKGFSKLLVCA